MRELPRPDIAQVWEHYGGRVVGRPTSGWQKAICPLHNDTEPSAAIHEDEQKWRCHACDKHGDVLDLIREAEGVDDFARLVERAEEFVRGGYGDVREAARRGGELSRRPGDRPSGRHFVPAWRRL